VLSRLFEVDLDIGQPSNRKVFQAMMEILIDPDRPGDFNQALMDLGSDIEAPVNPHPEDSPVKDFSAAYLHGTMDKYPIKAPKKKPVPVYLQGLIIENEQGQFLLEKNEAAGLLSGFWHFPLIEVEEFQTENQISLFSLFEVAENQPGLDLSPQESFEQDYDLTVDWQQQSFPKVQHVFSHRKWHIQLAYGRVKDSQHVADGEVLWLHPEEFGNYPFAKPQQKMWEAFRNVKDGN
jgi:A/G-specific adenine glycosylase, putative